MTGRRSRRHGARGLALLAVAALSTGCAHLPQADPKFLAAQPRSILVVPVVNKSVDTAAPDYFLSTVPVPLVERGYYVFPVNLVKRLLEDDGLADASLVHSADPPRLAALFGADAVLYVTIEKWAAQYMLLTTQVTVELSYVLRDGRTGDTLWRGSQRSVHSSDSGGLGILGAAINAAATKASPDYLPLARLANARVLAYPGPGFPAGAYRPDFGKDYAPAPAPGGTAGAARPAPAKVPAAAPGPTVTR
jgi:hypothetical protein